MLVLEQYDPQTSSFKFVREVYLYKNSEYEPFIKKDNSIDFIKESSFATNGKVLILHNKYTEHYFDVKTGVRIFKYKVPELAAAESQTKNCI